MATIQVNIHTQEKANQFLRALWAEIRSYDPSCTWIYSPIKNGKQKTITFGILHLQEQREKVQVGITYKQRGGIEFLFFKHLIDIVPTSHVLSGVENTLQRLAKIAIQKYEHPIVYNVTGYLQSEYSYILTPYIGKNFSIRYNQQDQTSVLTVKVSAYDEVDALIEYTKIAYKIIYLLSVETNIPFQIRTPVVENISRITPSTQENIYFEDDDWLDGVPNIDKFLYLSKESIEFIDWITICDFHDTKKERFLLACRHFYSARLSVSEEIPLVLCMSALEVASNIDQTKVIHCSECKQPVYKISQRVIDLVDEFLPHHITSFFKKSYSKRSKHLHEGAILKDESFYIFGKNIPQLNGDSLSGCETPSQISITNLWEFTSYCMRKVLKRMSEKS
jgi:hypothetical protein